jgi:hypothetical protein
MSGGVSYQFVTIDVTAAQALVMSNGRRTPPDGCATLKNLEIAGPFYRKRDAKKALVKWRQSYPAAKLVGYRMTRRYREEGHGKDVYGVSEWVA